MVATARVLRHEYGEDLRTVFIGPCVGKKRASIDTIHREVDAVLTFSELRQMLAKREITAESASADDSFDPPYGGVGTVFPIPGGLLQTAGLQEDLLSGELVIAEGRNEFVSAITEFDLAHADVRLLDVLACAGCYTGAGMTSKETALQRRARISNYAKNRVAQFPDDELAAIATPAREVCAGQFLPSLCGRLPAHGPGGYGRRHPRDPASNGQVQTRGLPQLWRLRLRELC